jgi:acyl dehydratase
MTTGVEAAIAGLKALVGMESAPATHVVERGHVLRFAAAIGDTNPLWSDEVAARRMRYGGLIAPPTFFRAFPAGPFPTPIKSPFTAAVDGGSEWEYFEPVHVGDAITVVSRLVDVSTRQGRLGTMLMMTRETRYTNQFGQLVATQRSTGINYAAGP